MMIVNVLSEKPKDEPPTLFVVSQGNNRKRTWDTFEDVSLCFRIFREFQTSRRKLSSVNVL